MNDEPDGGCSTVQGPVRGPGPPRTSHVVSLPEALRRHVAETWAFRRQEELDAGARFARLGASLEQLDAPEPLVSLARRAAEDERRHAGMCDLMARTYGHESSGADSLGGQTEDAAPPELGFRERVLYEVVAACCIAETESTAGLTSVLSVEGAPRVRAVLRDILRDEVAHSRLGWAYLGHVSKEGSVAFLSPYVPAMLESCMAPRLFAQGFSEADSSRLLAHGVLPSARKVEVFIQALHDVVFPSLERCGVDTSHALRWAERRRASGA
ncbi:ferritin-like domain-containing protein [Myxococcus hansupus]|uniref:ferritin-like domain-containing protein n=1 Tax=Pseudomyxococcus hansupus TaxID=1297742 RepID=UPI000AA02AC8|nr:ferritin-like domain-containing protein [Myxococcus hansupus]